MIVRSIHYYLLCLLETHFNLPHATALASARTALRRQHFFTMAECCAIFTSKEVAQKSTLMGVPSTLDQFAPQSATRPSETIAAQMSGNILVAEAIGRYALVIWAGASPDFVRCMQPYTLRSICLNVRAIMHSILCIFWRLLLTVW